VEKQGHGVVGVKAADADDTPKCPPLVFQSEFKYFLYSFILDLDFILENGVKPKS